MGSGGSAIASLVRGILRLAYRSILPITVREAVRLHCEVVQRELQAVVADAPTGRILVLAPHMDDDVFGCGGSLAKAAAHGAEVRVVFVSDGSRGYDSSRTAGFSAEQVRVFEQRLVETRKAEAKRAGAILGFSQPQFLDLPDGRIADAAGGVAQMSAVIRDFDPDAVFLPFLADQHPDHWATNKLFTAAGAAAGLRPSIACWGYEVWTPLVANTFVDVTSFMDRKRDAMAVFDSQNADLDYPRAITSLNAYRSLAAGLRQAYTEAFFVQSFAEYKALFKAIWPRVA